MTESVKDSDNDPASWMSLLGLLHPIEFFVTADHFSEWRKHLAWAKPKGQDLRNYTVQRFSSNMVFLSLLLGSEMNVLFNSSHITTDMRQAMMDSQYHTLKFWIGVTIVISACTTVIALVSTFTAWGMVSSISDNNAHCLLRSSIGQYITSLPSRYVVAALYLFLMWLVMFIVELLSGPIFFLVMGLVTFGFFQVVVPLSTFGRLIIYTGGMGNRRILEPEFEKALLPSGLHASLLIKATARKRKQQAAEMSYRAKKRNHRPSSMSSQISTTDTSLPSLQDGESQNMGTPRSARAYSLSMDDLEMIDEAREHFNGGDNNRDANEEGSGPRSVRPGHRHRRGTSSDSQSSESEWQHESTVFFPDASVLNRASGGELRGLVKHSIRGHEEMSPLAPLRETSESSSLRAGLNDVFSSPTKEVAFEQPPIAMKESRIPDPPAEKVRLEPLRGYHSRKASDKLQEFGRRQTKILGHRTTSSRALIDEWLEDDDVREIYNLPPPANIPEDDREAKRESTAEYVRRRRPSLVTDLNILAAFRSGSGGPPVAPKSDVETPDNEQASLLAQEHSPTCDYSKF